MKKLLFLFLFLPVLTFSQTQKINWLSLEEVETLMKKEPRKILIDVYTEWCGPCKMLNNTTFVDPKVVDYVNKNYYAVKFNAEGPEEVTFLGKTYTNGSYDPSRRGRNGTHDLTRAIAPVQGRIAYPTIVYMNEEFKIITAVQGYRNAEDFLPVLEFINTEQYQQNVSYDDYLKSRGK